jgi:hypothetical protein
MTCWMAALSLWWPTNLPSQSQRHQPRRQTPPPENDLNNLTRLCGLGRDDWALLEKSDSCNALDVFVQTYKDCPVLTALALDRTKQVCAVAPAVAESGQGSSSGDQTQIAVAPVAIATPLTTVTVPAVALDQPIFAATSLDGARGIGLNQAAKAISFDSVAGALDWGLESGNLTSLAMDRQGIVIVGITSEGQVVQTQSPD